MHRAYSMLSSRAHGQGGRGRTPATSTLSAAPPAQHGSAAFVFWSVLPVAVTDAGADLIVTVGLGAVPLAPFIASAVLECGANPIDRAMRRGWILLHARRSARS
ncbi:hypothetical protein B0H21DRAFT_826830 [Amylocystis lapponica]|nr:hypothetical protein B0H21DRAFT_826830 [Amylocystis lapponica]